MPRQSMLNDRGESSCFPPEYPRHRPRRLLELYISMEASMTRPARYLLGTIVVGILVLVLCGLALRRPVNENPFDQPAAAPPNP